jgi:hypothetical protein
MPRSHNERVGFDDDIDIASTGSRCLSQRPNFALKDAEPLKQNDVSLGPNDIDRNMLRRHRQISGPTSPVRPFLLCTEDERPSR